MKIISHIIYYWTNNVSYSCYILFNPLMSHVISDFRRFHGLLKNIIYQRKHVLYY